MQDVNLSVELIGNINGDRNESSNLKRIRHRD
jgi:hypothetical protein